MNNTDSWDSNSDEYELFNIATTKKQHKKDVESFDFNSTRVKKRNLNI